MSSVHQILRNMPKVRIKRFYYRSGQIHQEIRQIGGQRHGISRTWHRNGQLGQELRFRHGLLHGASREWNQNGRLLGSFNMNHGTGTQHYWHDNGQLHMEITSVNGRFHGRTRIWLRDGTLIDETFYLNNKPVTRPAYLKAARSNPDWPQYEKHPAGRVARRTVALQRKEHELFIESLLEKPTHAEARDWLSAKRPKRRSLARFATPTSALRFVDSLYHAGGTAVIVAAIYGAKKPGLFADWLLIRLPKADARRKRVRKICQEFCRRRGGGIEPQKDIRETHLFLMLA